MKIRPDILGGLAGLGMGLVDLGLLTALGVQMEALGRDVKLPVMAIFALSFAALGAALGRLWQARARARRDAATIQAQLEALEGSQRALLQGEKMAAVGRLAAGIAHELRNPLGVIRASASLLHEGAQDPEDARACAMIVEEIDRLNALITGLLEFASPARRPRQRLSPAAPLARAVALAHRALARQELRLEAPADAALPDIEGDPDLLCQLILGLLDNAAAALPRGGLIRVRAATDGAAVLIDVADDGPGVPDALQEQIFEPFFTTRPEGTGLGLAIAARVAQEHGGRLSLLPGQGAGPGGQGACFRLQLPLPPQGAPCAPTSR